MTQDEIRAFFAAEPAVHIQVAGPGDGSPELAWGDTFIYLRDRDGAPNKMPFATIVIKDYDGFDSESRLARGGLFRLNLDIGQRAFAELFGFAARDFAQRRGGYDFAAVDRVFPHPAYGEQAWISVINPRADNAQVRALMQQTLDRARDKAAKAST